ncbi:MAG: TolC family protein [Bacteroidota bacterium]
MKKWLLMVLLIGMMGVPVLGQDTIAVYKDELLEKVAQTNLSVQLAQKDAEMAMADYRQSHSLFLPSVQLSHTATYTNNPLMAFGTRLNQEILTQEDFNPDLLNNPDPIDNYATEILVMQPLFNLDGIHEREAAKIKSEATLLQRQRTQEYVAFEAMKTYMQLQMGYDAVDVLQRAKQAATKGVSMVQDYYEQGMVRQSDVLSAQVRLGEVDNQLTEAMANVRNGSDYLALLTGEESGGQVYMPADRLIDETIMITLSDSLNGSRKDLQAMEMSVLGYAQMAQARKSSFLPRVNAFGSFQFYDDRLFGFDASGYLLGVSLSWKLFDGYKSIGKVQKAQAEHEKAKIANEQYVKQNQLEWDKSKRQLAVADKKLALSRLAMEQSEEAYRITKDRFQEGMEKTTDYLMAETQYYSKALEYRRAIFEYNLTSEYLKFLTR